MKRLEKVEFSLRRQQCRLPGVPFYLDSEAFLQARIKIAGLVTSKLSPLILPNQHFPFFLEHFNYPINHFALSHGGRPPPGTMVTSYLRPSLLMGRFLNF